MIVLCFAMQGEDITHILSSMLMTRTTCLRIRRQEEDILEHINVKCHLCTL